MRFPLAVALVLCARHGAGQGLPRMHPLDALRADEPTAIAACDLDADGVPDLVVTRARRVQWHPGHGTRDGGHVVPDTTWPAEGVDVVAGEQAVTVGGTCELRGGPYFGDVDRDGRLDLLVVGPSEPAAPWESGDGVHRVSPSTPPLRWHRGAPGGRFAAGEPLLATNGRPWLVPDGCTGLAFADWNGDGALDALTVTRRGDVLLHAGHESRIDETGVALGAQAVRVAVCDWDGDGDLDLLTCDGVAAVALRTNVGTRAAPVLAAPEALVTLAGTDVLEFAPIELQPGVAGIVTAARRDHDVLPPVGLTAEEAIQLELADALIAQAEAKLRKLSEARPTDFTVHSMRQRQLTRAEMESWVARPRQIARELHRKREPTPAPFRFALHAR